MTNIFLHIGLHKTATTTLQQQFFPVCKELNYISRVPVISEFKRAVVTSDPIFYDAENQRKLLSPYLHHDLPNLLSAESFSGALYAGLIKHGLDHRSSILENLKASLPEARIIIVLRRQDRLARSLYRQYLKRGGTASVDKFYGLDTKTTAMFPLNRFRFSPYVDKLASCFPAGVLVLVFEEFLEQQSVFLKKLCDFIDIPVPNIVLTKSNQTSLGPAGMELSRILNKFFKSHLNPDALIPKIPKIRNRYIEWTWPSFILHEHWPFRGTHNIESQLYKISDVILDRVRDDNRILDNRYNLDLSRYNYY